MKIVVLNKNLQLILNNITIVYIFNNLNLFFSNSIIRSSFILFNSLVSALLSVQRYSASSTLALQAQISKS